MMSATIYLKDFDEILCISEGDGTNLLDEDIAEGYVDYLYYTEHNPNTMEEFDGGQIMETKPVSDLYTSCASKDCLQRVLEFICGSKVNVNDFEYEILEDK